MNHYLIHCHNTDRYKLYEVLEALGTGRGMYMYRYSKYVPDKASFIISLTDDELIMIKLSYSASFIKL